MTATNEELPAYADVSTGNNETVHTEAIKEKKTNTNDEPLTVTDVTEEKDANANDEPLTEDTEDKKSNKKSCGQQCKECQIMVLNWPKSLQIAFVIGTFLFYMAIIGSIEGLILVSKANKYKPHSYIYPFEIQCLITASKSVESSVYGCGTGYGQSPLYEDFVYYKPKCSMINETFSDEEERRIQTGDSCEDEFDSEAGPLRQLMSVKVNSTMDCYANSNCTAITFYDYAHWKSYHTQGVLWSTASVVFSCAVICWLVYKCYKNKQEAQQCCTCGYITILTLMLPIYGVAKFVVYIDSIF